MKLTRSKDLQEDVSKLQQAFHCNYNDFSFPAVGSMYQENIILGYKRRCVLENRKLKVLKPQVKSDKHCKSRVKVKFSPVKTLTRSRRSTCSMC